METKVTFEHVRECIRLGNSKMFHELVNEKNFPRGDYDAEIIEGDNYNILRTIEKWGHKFNSYHLFDPSKISLREETKGLCVAQYILDEHEKDLPRDTSKRIQKYLSEGTLNNIRIRLGWYRIVNNITLVLCVGCLGIGLLSMI